MLSMNTPVGQTVVKKLQIAAVGKENELETYYFQQLLLGFRTEVFALHFIIALEFVVCQISLQVLL